MEDKGPVDINKLVEELKHYTPLGDSKFHITPFDIVSVMKHRSQNPCQEIILDSLSMHPLMKFNLIDNDLFTFADYGDDYGLFTWEDYEHD